MDKGPMLDAASVIREFEENVTIPCVCVIDADLSPHSHKSVGRYH